MKLIVWLVKTFTRLCFRIKIHNLSKLPMNGKAIICANHTSNWDGVILYLFLPRHIHFLAKKELFENKFLRKLLLSQDVIPVDRTKPGLKTIKDCIEVLNKKNMLGIFPQGTRMEELREEDVKSGVALIAFKTNAPVIPIKIQSDFRFLGKVDVFIGDRIEPCIDENYSQKENYEIWSRKIIKNIKELGFESSSC